MKVRYGPSGIHMFDRKSGLNVLMDEIDVPEEQWSSAPRYVSIALTNSCDLTCPHCYAAKHPAKLNKSHVEKWVSDLDAAGCLGVGFGGGEPTLYPEFALLCSNVQKETGLAVTMTTHGHRFTPELATKLAGEVQFIRLSMDGIGATYERLRGRSFATFTEKLHLIRETARFGINYVVNGETIADLPLAADFAFCNGAEELLLLPEVGVGGKLAVSSEVMESLSGWIDENYKRCRLATSVAGGTYIEAPMLLTGQPESESYEFLHIDASGVLKTNAYARSGISVSQWSSIIEAIYSLRHGAKGGQRTMDLEVVS